MSKTDVAIVIANYNGRGLLEVYFPSVLKAAEKAGARVVVIDDASTDDGVAWLRKNAPAATVIEAAQNRGFLENCNRGVKSTPCDIVILLNTDVGVEENFIAPLIRHFREADDVFAVSPRIHNLAKGGLDSGLNHFYFEHGLLRVSYPGLAGAPVPDHAVPIGYACGGAAAVDWKKFMELGGFDPVFRPNLTEDTDLSYRAWKRGWRVLYEPESEVVHQHQATRAAMDTEARMRAQHSERQFWLVWKNVADPVLLFLHLANIPRIMAGHVRHRRWPELWGMARAPARLCECIRAREKNQAMTPDREIMWRNRPGQ